MYLWRQHQFSNWIACLINLVSLSFITKRQFWYFNFFHCYLDSFSMFLSAFFGVLPLFWLSFFCFLFLSSWSSCRIVFCAHSLLGDTLSYSLGRCPILEQPFLHAATPTKCHSPSAWHINGAPATSSPYFKDGEVYYGTKIGHLIKYIYLLSQQSIFNLHCILNVLTFLAYKLCEATPR